jgi:hypothetical protein
MKERGRYQIQFMKTRSSSGVGQKVDLEFNIDTLRITDLAEEDDSSLNQQRHSTTNNIINGLKRTSEVSTSTTDVENQLLGSGKNKPNVGSQIRTMLSKISDINTERD